MDRSESIARVVGDFLDKDGWEFVLFDDEDKVFSFQCGSESKLYNLTCRIHINHDSYIVLVESSVSAGDRKAEVAEFITRANYCLCNGNFEMDYNDGEIRYRSYVDCEDNLPSEKVIKNSIYVPLAMFTKYGDGLGDVIFGKKSPEEAARQCEEYPEDCD